MIIQLKQRQMYMKNMAIFKDLVPLKNSIYVTFLPDENSSRVIEDVKKT